MPAEYIDIKYSNPTAVYRFVTPRCNGTIIGSSFFAEDFNTTGLLQQDSDELFLKNRESFTNFSLSNREFGLNTPQFLIDDSIVDIDDFSVQPNYVRKIKMKVKIASHSHKFSRLYTEEGLA